MVEPCKECGAPVCEHIEGLLIAHASGSAYSAMRLGALLAAAKAILPCIGRWDKESELVELGDDLAAAVKACEGEVLDE